LLREKLAGIKEYYTSMGIAHIQAALNSCNFWGHACFVEYEQESSKKNEVVS